MLQVLERFFRTAGGLLLGAVVASILIVVAVVVGLGLIIGCAAATGQGRMTVRWRA